MSKLTCKKFGDFYEFFGDDALIVGRELELTITRRSRQNGKTVDAEPMVGFPYHCYHRYVAILQEKGYSVEEVT